MSEAITHTDGDPDMPREWIMPSPRKVGMICLIILESTLFIIFVVAYLFYMYKSLNPPYPWEVLEVPIIPSLALFASSITVWLGEVAFHKNKVREFQLWWAITFALGTFFAGFTFMEWHHLIYNEGLTISINLFGSTFYSLVGLHLTHVIVALFLIGLCLMLSFFGRIPHDQSERIAMVSWYKHFVVAVWVIVWPVVYMISTIPPQG